MRKETGSNTGKLPGWSVDPSVRDRLEDVVDDSDSSHDQGADNSADSTEQADADVTEPDPLPPVAVAAEHLDGLVGQPVSFDASASTDPDGTIVTYSWDFGDGTFGTGPEIQHTFSAAGVFDASVEVEDDQGLTDVAYIEVDIAADGNQPPIAVIEGLPEEAVVGHRQSALFVLVCLGTRNRFVNSSTRNEST